MNCLGVDRAKSMVDAIVKMEKAAVLAPALEEHMIQLIALVHREHTQCKDWMECQMPICARTQGLAKIAKEVFG